MEQPKAGHRQLSDVQAKVVALLDQVRRVAPEPFSGLGLILYVAPVRMPISDLGDQATFTPHLPVVGHDAIARVLGQIATTTSPWHDGFHLIEASSWALTHVSQFVSPSVSDLKQARPLGAPVGARQLAALAMSRLPSVETVAVLGARTDLMLCAKGVAIFERGAAP